MSANAESLFDDYWFVLAPPGHAVDLAAELDRSTAPAMRQSLLNTVRCKPLAMSYYTSRDHHYYTSRGHV